LENKIREKAGEWYMNIVITGIGGMVGSHLADYLFRDHHIIGTYYKPTVNLDELPAEVELIECDVRYFNQLYSCINHYRPDKIFHLAAQSYPTVSLVRPDETMDTNIIGTINIFEAIKQVRSMDTHFNPKIVVACSSAEYGASLVPENIPVTENAPLQPLHPYGVSKVAQDLITYQYFVNDGLYGIRARIFNTTGPRKINDVCSDFTKKIVEIEQGRRQFLPVGNLETRRAITDVRDLVNALWLLSEKADAGEVYNISGRYVYKISELINIIRQFTSIPFEIRTDPALLRPTDEPIIYGDSSRLEDITGWKQSYCLEDTIQDMLNYWRSHT
jgi:GDP-mannose 4,6-dehydratase